MARLHIELAGFGYGPAIALRALDRLAAAVIVADSDGSVIQTNRAAERILQRGDGLVIRNGNLGVLHVVDSAARSIHRRSGCRAENRGSDRTHARPTT